MPSQTPPGVPCRSLSHCPIDRCHAALQILRIIFPIIIDYLLDLCKSNAPPPAPAAAYTLAYRVYSDSAEPVVELIPSLLLSQSGAYYLVDSEPTVSAPGGL